MDCCFPCVDSCQLASSRAPSQQSDMNMLYLWMGPSECLRSDAASAGHASARKLACSGNAGDLCKPRMWDLLGVTVGRSSWPQWTLGGWGASGLPCGG
jgi:hypothetical protein